MSGHNKWSKIKRKKGAEDAKRSKMFSRLAKDISIAIKEKGGDANPDTNPQLRTAINNAKGVNMPKENIERAISKAQKDPDNLEKETFEGYLPNGVAVYIECLTDNHNRTVGAVRSVFNKRGGNMGTKGSLDFQFEQKGVLTIPARDDIDSEEFQLEIIDAGAEEFEYDEGYYIITTTKDNFGKIQKKLEEMNIESENAELRRIPVSTTQLDTNSGKKILKIIEEFEDLDDVQRVFHNLEITDELVEAMEAG